jgi:hypothetical protein
MVNCFRASVIFLLLAAPLTSTGLQRSDLLPADAQTTVQISNTSRFWNSLKQSPSGRLWADRQFQDFIGNPDAEVWQEFLFENQSEAESKVTLEQLKMLDGEVVLAFDADHEEPYIVAAISKEDYQRSVELDENLVNVMEEPFDIVKGSFQDVEIVRFVEHPGTAKASSCWQAYCNNTLVVGYSREWVEQCIVKLQKEAVTEPEGVPSLNLNIPLASLIQKSIQQKRSAPNQSALLDALGILNINHLSVKMELRDGEMVIDNLLNISSLARGLFTIIDVQPSELPIVTFIPEDIASLEVGRFNLLRFWQEIPSVLAAMQPGMKPQFDLLLAMIQQQAGIDIELDLLLNLGSKYVSFSTMENDRQISVIVIDLKDGPAFKKSLETAFGAPAVQPYVTTGLDIEPFLDHTVYTLKKNQPDEPVAFAVTGDYLLYGHPDGIRQVIRSSTSESAANPAFEQSALVRGLRQHVPSRAFTYNAIDWKKNIDLIVRGLTKPEYRALIEQNWARSGAALAPPDFRKLPPADHIASFFNISYQYIEACPEGLHQRIILEY